MSTTATATGGINSSPMKAALEKNGFKGCKDDDLEPVFKYLEFCLKQVGAVGWLVPRSAWGRHLLGRVRDRLISIA